MTDTELMIARVEWLQKKREMMDDKLIVAVRELTERHLEALRFFEEVDMPTLIEGFGLSERVTSLDALKDPFWKGALVGGMLMALEVLHMDENDDEGSDEDDG